MFSQNVNPASRQVRAELRGKFPDSWTDEVLMALEYTDPADMGTEDFQKVKIASLFSPTLQRLLGGTQPPPAPQTLDVQTTNDNPFTRFLPWSNHD